MKNATRGIRFGELLEPLKAKAKAEGITVTEAVKRGVQTYLEIPFEGVRHDVNFGRTGRHNDQSNVRWGWLIEFMIERAIDENTSLSSIARRAVRLYLGDSRVPEIKGFMKEFRQAHANMARVGGNLHRIARVLNTDNIFPETELARAHDELLDMFKELADLYSRVEQKLDQQMP
jgi:hypothetical protein